MMTRNSAFPAWLAPAWREIARRMSPMPGAFKKLILAGILKPRRLRSVLLLVVAFRCLASENVPHAPFARWADLPSPGRIEVGLNYQESESYYFWAGGTRYKADDELRGENYGIDINQGFIALQYGVAKKWALDLSIGYTSVGWRYFSNFSTNGSSESTSGLMDTALGVRYQIFQECHPGDGWRPTLTFRAGGILPGTFDENFPFAPGVRSVAIEPELLLRKQFGWIGLGLYADGLFRWNKTSANDQWITSVGLFQKIAGWEFHAGYRHLGSVGGEDIHFDPATRLIDYPRAVRESNDSVEAGFDYTTPKLQIRMGFYSKVVFDGNNTDKKFWVGPYLEIPFVAFKPRQNTSPKHIGL